LSLASDDEAYAIPVSFGYDGERALMYLLRFGEDSEKLAVANDTEQVLPCNMQCRVTLRVAKRDTARRPPRISKNCSRTRAET
jgi:hypothetical protein